MYRVVGVLGFFSSILLLIHINCDLDVFWDLKIFIFVISSSLFLYLTDVKNVKEIRWSESTKFKLSESLEKIGGIGAIVGFIQMLQNLFAPEHLGRALAVSLLSIFYSQIIIALIGVKNKSDYLNYITLAILLSSFVILALVVPKGI